MSFPPPVPPQPHGFAGGQSGYFGQGVPVQGYPAGPGYPTGQSYPPGYPADPGYPIGQSYPPGPGYPSGQSYPPDDSTPLQTDASNVNDAQEAPAPPYAGQQTMSGDQGNADDTDGFAGSAFNDKSIRRKFISKVYLILSVQLLVTLGFVSTFLFVTPIKRWVQRNQWFYWISYATFLATYIALACCSKVRRRFPGNFIALGIFTLAFSYLAGTITSYYSVNSVLICLAITIGVTVTVSIAAACCPCDITKCQAAIAILSILFFLFGMICTIVFFAAGYNSTLHAVYGGVAAVVFTIYLAYDTQMILGGRKFEMSPEEYIFGALQLYLDVVNIFLAMLALFGSRG